MPSMSNWRYGLKTARWNTERGRSELGERIRALRISANMTQQDLADRLGIKRSRLAHWERGTKRLPWHMLPSLGEHLHGFDELELKQVYSRHHPDVAELVDYEGRA